MWVSTYRGKSRPGADDHVYPRICLSVSFMLLVAGALVWALHLAPQQRLNSRLQPVPGGCTLARIAALNSTCQVGRSRVSCLHAWAVYRYRLPNATHDAERAFDEGGFWGGWLRTEVCRALESCCRDAVAISASLCLYLLVGAVF